MTQDKTKLFKDVYSNIIPERVPIDVGISFEAVAQYGGLDIKDVQWNPKLVADATKEICERLHSDTAPVYGTSRPASLYKFMGSKSFVFSADGVMQHPEVSSLNEEDYDYFIEHPYDCMIERALPRFNTGINYETAPQAMLNYAKGVLARDGEGNEYRSATAEIIAKYNYFKGFGGASTAAPFDYLSDILRSFKGISVDVRRNRNRVKDACEALLPILFKMGTPANVNELTRANYWTHMPTFLRSKDFEELWWPSFYKMANNYAAMGMGINAWCEDDWTRYVDHLSELPTNSILRFEYGDAKLYKEKLGNKHILSGLYPFSSLKTNTKEECIDIAKQLIDDMAGGGRFVFNFDKVLMMIDYEEFDKLCALVDFVKEYGTYSNAGEKSGLDYKRGDYSPLPTRTFESKYYTIWKDVEGISAAAAKKLQSYEDKNLLNVLSFFR